METKNQELDEPKNCKIIVFLMTKWQCLCVWVFYYVVNMFSLRLTAPIVEVPLKYTIREFTTLKKSKFPRGGENYINYLAGFMVSDSTWQIR